VNLRLGASWRLWNGGDRANLVQCIIKKHGFLKFCVLEMSQSYCAHTDTDFAYEKTATQLISL
jgi:hypothetical protein